MRVRHTSAGYTVWMDPDVQWEVVRLGDTVRIDLTRATTFTQADTDAVVAATSELLTHDEVRSVRLDGPVFLEERGRETDGWRGEINEGNV